MSKLDTELIRLKGERGEGRALKINAERRLLLKVVKVSTAPAERNFKISKLINLKN